MRLCAFKRQTGSSGLESSCTSVEGSANATDWVAGVQSSATLPLKKGHDLIDIKTVDLIDIKLEVRLLLVDSKQITPTSSR